MAQRLVGYFLLTLAVSVAAEEVTLHTVSGGCCWEFAVDAASAAIARTFGAVGVKEGTCKEAGYPVQMLGENTPLHKVELPFGSEYKALTRWEKNSWEAKLNSAVSGVSQFLLGGARTSLRGSTPNPKLAVKLVSPVVSVKSAKPSALRPRNPGLILARASDEATEADQEPPLTEAQADVLKDTLEFRKLRYFNGRVGVWMGRQFKPMWEVFAPSVKDDTTAVASVVVQTPFGMIIEESAKYKGKVEVMEVNAGSNAEKAGIKVGDVLRATTAMARNIQKDSEEDFGFSVGLTEGSKVRALLMTDNQPFEEVMRALTSNAPDNNGPGEAALVFERTVVDAPLEDASAVFMVDPQPVATKEKQSHGIGLGSKHVLPADSWEHRDASEKSFQPLDVVPIESCLDVLGDDPDNVDYDKLEECRVDALHEYHEKLVKTKHEYGEDLDSY
jgi:hypothetical protein